MSKENSFGIRLSEWWKQQTAKPLLSFYFNDMVTYFVGSFLFSYYFALTAWVINRTLTVLFSSDFLVDEMVLSELGTTGLIVFLSYIIGYFILDYFRKRTTATFKVKGNLRAKILERKKWMRFFFVTQNYLLLLLISCFILAIFFARFNELVDFSQVPLQGIFSVSASGYIFLEFFNIYLDNGMNQKDDLIYIADSLETFKRTNIRKLDKDLSKDDEYFVNAFVKTISRLILYSMKIIEEVDLNGLLNKLLIARKWGNSSEKKKAQAHLSQLKKILQNKDWKPELIDWLEDVRVDFPRIAHLNMSIKIDAKKSKKSNRFMGTLKFIGLIATIGAFIITLIDIIIRHYFQ